jgi:thiamine-phosphate pyrophosphorylase
VESRSQRLERSLLYLVCDAQPDGFLHAVLAAGVDLVQLRMKGAPDQDILRTAARFRRVCTEYGALLILNDRPDLAATAGADGVHVGQDDMAVAAAREIVGPECLIGLSTHSPSQIDAAAGADYIGVGPIFQTPTKPGRAAVGLDLVAYAAARCRRPFFAIGGVSPDNVTRVRDAGARRVAVVRALTEASSPATAAHDLRQAVSQPEPKEAFVGTT